jgi:hypothetical protein
MLKAVVLLAVAPIPVEPFAFPISVEKIVYSLALAATVFVGWLFHSN